MINARRKIILSDYFFLRYTLSEKGGAMGEATLGRRLALAREKLGLSQMEVAERTGLKVQNISRIETTVRQHVRSDTLVRLAQALECSTDYLLGLSDEPTPKKRPRPRTTAPVS
jgi:transcriptional regulator with XRE-family HTH domain